MTSQTFITPSGTVSRLKIDFVSDVACPWCAVGLGALEQALANLGGVVHADIHFQPFQLNPNMPAEGQNIGEHLTEKYGSNAEQQAQTYAMIRERGREVGFDFRLEGRGRTWNTFDCHRLLHWAGDLDQAAKQEHAASGVATSGANSAPDGRPNEAQRSTHSIQHRMKKELLRRYFTEGQNPAARDVLLDVVQRLGLDSVRAATLLDGGEFTQQVRARQRFYQAQNIRAVPSIIINDRHLISGGQPVAVFENALRQMSALD
jgi:predicted DsbA family dithiol-disulfide isomerase